MDESTREIRDTLARALQRQYENEGEFRVLFTTVLALVKSHPDPVRFAERFRVMWLTALQEHPVEQAHPRAFYDGIELALAMLEDSCPVPLAVRAPPPHPGPTA